ncbi:hypothetical protein SEA_FORREST_63 [Streptomyces phage Forrest]|jgi:hypothetical protein|uniref:Uncharacterized protein n=2 Tax=Gilsonvirus gilson TaxID=2846398 RepID=A0A3T0ICN0_9CAUD|nr:hypothetical protein HWB98_gp189 [Streptomyces phage Gilson]AZU97140.1 hypothetical protein SEA_GILSON_62 [Streptomyces phage Gilson]QQV92429.1 hypothetical protein SEA_MEGANTHEEKILLA_60 [Streptomyces phage MeganTheeKilla]QZE11200.1 hypothetical protein SEA_FORREST_63 [Streptomyces phage Forrest]QZE11427.1 hypothetical protein SEA_JADA_61 [Streptomyces phage Jada]
MAEEPTQIDLAPFLAAAVEEAGGEIRIPYDVFRSQVGEKALAIDIEDDGATLVLRVVDGIPNE